TRGLLRDDVRLVRAFRAADQADRVAAVSLSCGAKPSSGPVQRLRPARFAKDPIVPDKRFGQPRSAPHACLRSPVSTLSVTSFNYGAGSYGWRSVQRTCRPSQWV